MGTAGSGDVLAGVIGALLGEGLSAWESARAGVLWHAQAGDLAGREKTERSMIASDIVDRLTRVVTC